MAKIDRDIERAIQKYSGQYDIDPVLIRAIIKQESGGNKNAVSPVGARGLMQIYGSAPVTDAIIHGKLKTRPNLNTVDGQIQAGTAYLATLRDSYGAKTVNNLLMAYNGGPKLAKIDPNASEAEIKRASIRAGGSGNIDTAQVKGYRDTILQNYLNQGGANTTRLPIHAKGSASSATVSGSGTQSGQFTQQPQQSTISPAQSPIPPSPAEVSGFSDPASSSNTSTGTGTGSANAGNTSAISARQRPVVDQGGTGFNLGTPTSSVVDSEQIISDATNNIQAVNVNNSFADVTRQLNDLRNKAGQVTSAFDQRNQQLNGNSFDPNAVAQGEVDTFTNRDQQFTDLTREAQARRADRELQRQEISRITQINAGTDSLNPDSTVSRLTETQQYIADRTAATERAKIALGDAPVGSPGWFARKLFGNPFVQGAKDLNASSNQIEQVSQNLDAQANRNYVNGIRNLEDPALLETKLKEDLKLLDLTTQTQLTEARQPLRAFNLNANQNNALNASDTQVLGARETEVNILQKRLANEQAQNSFGQSNTRFGQSNAAEARAQTRFNQEQANLPAKLEANRVALANAKTRGEATKAQIERTKLLNAQLKAEGVSVDPEIIAKTKELKRAKLETAAIQDSVSRKKLQDELDNLNNSVIQGNISKAKELEIQASIKQRTLDLQQLEDRIQAYKSVGSKTTSEAEILKLQADSLAQYNRFQQQAADKFNSTQTSVSEAQATQAKDIVKSSEQASRALERRVTVWEDILKQPPGSLSPERAKKLGAALDSIAESGRAGSNPLKAAILLQDLGVVAPETAIGETVSGIELLANQIVNAPDSQYKRAEDVPDALIKSNVEQSLLIPIGSDDKFNPTNLGAPIGVDFINTTLRTRVGRTPAVTIASDEVISAELSKAETPTQMIEAIANGLLSKDTPAEPSEINHTIADYFSAVVDTNNNVRGYKVLGVPEQKNFYVNIRLDKSTGLFDYARKLGAEVSVSKGIFALPDVNKLDLANPDDVQTFRLILNYNKGTTKQ